MPVCFISLFLIHNFYSLIFPAGLFLITTSLSIKSKYNDNELPDVWDVYEYKLESMRNHFIYNQSIYKN